MKINHGKKEIGITNFFFDDYLYKIKTHHIILVHKLYLNGALTIHVYEIKTIRFD